jgi:hypothetical protein
MYAPNEPIRGKYLVRLEEKIAEDIAAIEARRQIAEESRTRVHRLRFVLTKQLEKARSSFFAAKTDRSVSSDIVSAQPNFLG